MYTACIRAAIRGSRGISRTSVSSASKGSLDGWESKSEAKDTFVWSMVMKCILKVLKQALWTQFIDNLKKKSAVFEDNLYGVDV